MCKRLLLPVITKKKLLYNFVKNKKFDVYKPCFINRTFFYVFIYKDLFTLINNLC